MICLCVLCVYCTYGLSLCSFCPWFVLVSFGVIKLSRSGQRHLRRRKRKIKADKRTELSDKQMGRIKDRYQQRRQTEKRIQCGMYAKKVNRYRKLTDRHDKLDTNSRTNWHEITDGRTNRWIRIWNKDACTNNELACRTDKQKERIHADMRGLDRTGHNRTG